MHGSFREVSGTPWGKGLRKSKYFFENFLENEIWSPVRLQIWLRFGCRALGRAFFPPLFLSPLFSLSASLLGAWSFLYIYDAHKHCEVENPVDPGSFLPDLECAINMPHRLFGATGIHFHELLERLLIPMLSSCKAKMRCQVAPRAETNETFEGLRSQKFVIVPALVRFHPKPPLGVRRCSTNLTLVAGTFDDHVVNAFPIAFGNTGSQIREPRAAWDEINKEAASKGPVLAKKFLRNWRFHLPCGHRLLLSPTSGHSQGSAGKK